MILKIRRSQKQSGMISTTVMFCIDARVELTEDERQDVKHYKLGTQIIYSNERHSKTVEALLAAPAAPRYQAGASMESQLGESAKAMGSLLLAPYKMLGAAALHSLNLNISIDSLQKGHHIECKNLDEVMATEAAIQQACANLKGYIETASTFDGREDLYEFGNASA